MAADFRISEVANALYADSFALDGLEHIFVRRIVNDETKSCLEDFILLRHPGMPVSGSLTLDKSDLNAVLGSRIG